MSGKPSHGSRGNTRRGAHKSSTKSSGMPKKEINSIKDYNYYLGSAKQASNYETTTEFLINYIVKTFEYGNDIGQQALRELEYPHPDSWKPTMRQSTHLGNDPDDEAQRAFENKQFEIKFKSEFDNFRIRK
jgi:hypothetical protein